MFEKSLYDLIKGLRNHKGTEEDYVQDCLRECKAEIKLQDMDKKATALLKLIYLEMFGYDMSWASFHVLEVMSSTKYLQKRAGYLAAVQSFRSDTEVLMLATNLLKKDLISSSIPNMSLPLITLPNIITPSLALSLLPDVLSRLSHSHSVIRKKAIVCLYRLALVYPDALKLAWPKIKDRLMDNEEDSSVTTAVINVVCELGWRRPHDFLPLAPRFFDLLVDGGNNWMAIKIIKLFATLTPLEPRLIRKLIRPLMNIIQTTTAMSLLYECINGIIQGGILDGDEGLDGKEEIASLCVGKLRGMVVTDSDPNLKYVALLAFNRIVISYPILVSIHQDVIMDCLEDPDISIRLQALELAVRMVTGDTLQAVVERLLDQLLSARQIANGRHAHVKSNAHTSWENSEPPSDEESQKAPFALPYDYNVEVLHRILDVCSHDNYSELPDFEWYVDVLKQLIKLLPAGIGEPCSQLNSYHEDANNARDNIAFRVGSEIRNIAVRVRDVRMEATRAAESLLLIDNREYLAFGAIDDILGPLAWVVGEYAEYLLSPSQTLHSLIDMTSVALSPRTLSLYVQAIPKVLVSLVRNNDRNSNAWNTQRASETSLLLARVIKFLEALAAHPDLDVQERSIEFLEVMRLAADALNSETSESCQVPFLLSSMIPNLFYGLELNPVAANAQRRVPLPEHLFLDQPMNNNLHGLFSNRTSVSPEVGTPSPFQDFYYIQGLPALNRPVEPVQSDSQLHSSYQHPIDGLDETAAVVKRKAERKERNRDDPFYIGAEDESSGTSTPFHQAFTASNGGELDIDSIPIIDLKLDGIGGHQPPSSVSRNNRRNPRPRPKRYEVISDEVIGQESSLGSASNSDLSRAKRSLLQVDSSGLKHLPLEGNANLEFNSALATGQDAEMAMAIQEVERVRLEMQRASERVHADGIPTEGTLIKKKRKVKKSTVSGLQNHGSLDLEKGPVVDGGNIKQGDTHPPVVKRKRKTKKQTKN